MPVIEILHTDYGDFPTPKEMTELSVKWRKHGDWPDMRTKNGKEWVRMFWAFTKSKARAT